MFLELQLYVCGILISVLNLSRADVVGKRHTSFPLSNSAYPNLGASVQARLLQSFSKVCDPVDCSWPGSSVHGIFQERSLQGIFLTQESNLRLFTAEPPGKPNSGGMRQNNLQEIISTKAKVERVIWNGAC